MTQNKVSKAKPITKKQQVIKLLKRSNGASLSELSKATGWQGHSIRGFLSGTLRKKLGLDIENFKDKKGVRKYHIQKIIHRTNTEGGSEDPQPQTALTKVV